MLREHRHEDARFSFHEKALSMGIGAAIFSGVTAPGRAAEAQERGIQLGIEESRRQFDLNREDLAPFRQGGVNALGRLDQLNEGDFSGFFTSPGFEFRREEGLRGIENRFSASGGALSGNALRRLTEFNSGLASQEFGNFFNRNLRQAGLGQTATQAGVVAGTNISGNISNALQRSGDVRASGILGQNEAIQGLLENALFATGASDIRLKENIELIGSHKGHNIYTWSWNEIARSLAIDSPTIGVMAQEIPDEFVHQRDGYLTVDYRGLFDG